MLITRVQDRGFRDTVSGVRSTRFSTDEYSSNIAGCLARQRAIQSQHDASKGNTIARDPDLDQPDHRDVMFSAQAHYFKEYHLAALSYKPDDLTLELFGGNALQRDAFLTCVRRRIPLTKAGGMVSDEKSDDQMEGKLWLVNYPVDIRQLIENTVAAIGIVLQSSS